MFLLLERIDDRFGAQRCISPTPVVCLGRRSKGLGIEYVVEVALLPGWRKRRARSWDVVRET